MRRFVFTLELALVLALAYPLGAKGQFNGRNDRRSSDRVCLYENSYFQGREDCYRPGEEIRDLRNRRNSVSSIRVFGNAIITIFDSKNFDGRSLQISSDVRDLAQVSAGGLAGLSKWNDRIESFRVSNNIRTDSRTDSRNDRRDSRSDRRNDYDNAICVYEETNYRGGYDCFAPGDELNDLERRSGWNDRISSIRVYGNARATVYVDARFRGERLVVDHDIPDLGRMRLRDRSWDNQISSIDVVGSRGRDSNRRYYRYRY